jgi:hypothetical protein
MARRTNADLAFDDARLRIATEVLRQPEYARVYWDDDLDAWTIRCRACGLAPRVATKEVYQLTDKAIKKILTNVAVRHNQDKHGG